MAEKKASLGICDLCGSQIPGDIWTTKRTPKLYCSRQCRNTGNSRAGAHIIAQKNRERIERGEWQNPAEINPPDPAKIGAGSSLVRKAEVAAGTWRNPALTEKAKSKLSRPRVHGDNPSLHSAIEKLGRGDPVASLTPEEREAHRAYRRDLRSKRQDEDNAYRREYYRRRQAAMTEDEREPQRQKWREKNRRRAQKKSTRE